MPENVEPTASDRGTLRDGGLRGSALSPRIDGARVAMSYTYTVYILATKARGD